MCSRLQPAPAQPLSSIPQPYLNCSPHGPLWLPNVCGVIIRGGKPEPGYVPASGALEACEDRAPCLEGSMTSAGRVGHRDSWQSLGRGHSVCKAHGDPAVEGGSYRRTLGSRAAGGRGGPGCEVGMRGQGGALSARQEREPLGTTGALGPGEWVKNGTPMLTLGVGPPAWWEHRVRVAGGHQAQSAQQLG